MGSSGRLRGPEFIGVGPPKTGTSWLFDHLNRHPDIWIPPIKELHWFDEVQAGGPYSLPQRLWGRRPEAQRWRRYLREQLLYQVVKRPHQEPVWKLRYVFRRRSDEEYLNLFRHPVGTTTGEITPAYCDLDDAMVRHVHELLPDARVLIQMRNPIERSWSDCRRTLGRRRGRAVEEIPREEILAFLETPQSLERSDYVTIIDRWRAWFPPSQVRATFLDDIETDAARQLLEIFEFLGVDASARHVSNTAADRVHVGWGSSDVPPEYRHRLAELLREPIERAADELGGPAVGWLDYARAS